MRKLFLSLGLLLGLIGTASAQCIGVSGVAGPFPIAGISCLSEPSIATYAASGIGIVPASSATDIACIQGSATTTVRIQQVLVSGTAGTTVIVPVVLMKRASANTGGTPATGTALPVAAKLDSANVAATATLNSWTANPTIPDSSPGIIAVGNLMLSKTDGTNGVSAPFTMFDLTEANYSQKVILRGVAQGLCVNLNATSPSSGLVNVTFRWTEASQ